MAMSQIKVVGNYKYLNYLFHSILSGTPCGEAMLESDVRDQSERERERYTNNRVSLLCCPIVRFGKLLRGKIEVIYGAVSWVCRAPEPVRICRLWLLEPNAIFSSVPEGPEYNICVHRCFYT